MTLADVMKCEREGIMVEYIYPQGYAKISFPPYSAVTEISVIVDKPSYIRSQHPVTVQPFPLTRKEHQGFVQICPTLKYKFLWTDVENDGYRDDYIAFLKEYYGMAIANLPGEYHVDHLFNRARARKLGLRLVRMVLLPKLINISHGPGYEKARTNGILGREGRWRKVDSIMLMKLYGISSPRKGQPLTPEMMTYIRRIAGVLNISSQEAEQEIQEMRDVANFRPNA